MSVFSVKGCLGIFEGRLVIFKVRLGIFKGRSNISTNKYYILTLRGTFFIVHLFNSNFLLNNQ